MKNLLMAIAAFFGFGYANAQEAPRTQQKPKTTTTVKSSKAAKSTKIADKLEAKKTNIAATEKKSDNKTGKNSSSKTRTA